MPSARNGARASFRSTERPRRACLGDLLIIAAFGLVAEERVAAHKPWLVFVDAANRIKELHSQVPVQTAETEALMV